MPKYLSPLQLTEMFPGTTTGYWGQLRYLGKGPRFLKPSPKKVIYVEADVMSWLASKEMMTTDQSPSGALSRERGRIGRGDVDPP